MTTSRSSRFRRLSKGFIVFGMMFLFAANLAMPFTARAQTSPEEAQIVIPGAGYPVAITGNVYEEIAKKFKGFFSTLTIGGITALMNAFQVFTQRIAYDTAQRILTGDSGQYPLFWEDGYGDYLGKVAEDAGNQFISSINEEVFAQYGFDLCKPVDPFQTQLSLGLGQFAPPEFLKPKCTAAQIGAAYEEVYGSLTADEALNKYVAPQFSPRANELNVGIQIKNNYLDIKTSAIQAAQLDRQETEGLKNVQDAISGKIQTPSAAIKTTLAETNPVKQQNDISQANYLGLVGNAFEIGFTQLAVITVATFVNTLAGGLIQKLFDGLTGGTVDVAELDLASPEAVGNRNIARARVLFADLLTPNLISTDQQDFVTELSACPNPRGLWNCAMDDAMTAALRTVGETGAYTVGRASHVVLGGDPPSNPAFLHKEWELIPESDAKESTDSTCYQRAYCATNLAKLRYARILPVGWELAANSPYNKKRNGKYVTLEEAIRGFNVCNEEGKADSTHPWCNLIDPNWVLSAPPFQCRVKGGGNTVLSGTTIRLEECADAVSCLGRDDKGKCTQGYGYCLAEKPVWRFPADACLERFASCRTYTNRANQRVSYLRNTIDYGSCSADNVGCLWYATERDPASGTQEVWAGSASSGQRIYLDATAKTCPASADGCTRVLQVTPGSPALNLVNNGSFEATLSDENDTANVAGWTLSSNNLSFSTDIAIFDERSLVITGAGQATGEQIAIEPVRNFTFTVLARPAASSTAATFTATITLRQANGAPVVAANVYKSSSCTVATDSTVGFDEAIAAGDEDGWRRYECSFVSNPDAKSAVVTIVGSNIALDALQLEESEAATSFVNGIAPNLTEVHLRVPPEEFQCQGIPSDHPSCSKYARACRPSDQGCQGYKDIANPGAPEIPASLSAVDFCPASCVGYGEYRKQPSAFDLGKNADPRLDDPQDETSSAFIPAFAQQCVLADIGCEEFTNVETAGGEGEDKAYFNYVRACEKPSENSETYFTWEGSDTSGYQLRTWSLIHDPNTLPNAPKILQKTGPDGSLKDANACTAAAWQTGADPDCRQFFNANGVVFYAYFSQTVISSPSCRDFRKNGSNAADCEKTGGTFTPVSGECIYKILPEESRSCRNVNAGCRAYIGTTGRNTTVVFEEDFRSGTTTASFTTGELSNESILVGDQSLKVTGPNPTLSTATVFPSVSNQLYSVSFWAKTTSNQQQVATLLVDGNVVGTFPMQVDWRRYEFGPFPAAATPTSTITFANLPNASFLDQIRIERLQDVTYVVKNSWTTPQECERTPEGLPEPQAMLGCRAYRDRNNNTVTVRRFGQLCREESIGCKAFIDTRNSESPYAETFTVNGTDINTKTTPEAIAHESKYVGSVSTTRAADRYVYLIDEPASRCDSTNASCRAFGKPKYAQDQLSLEAPSSSSFETVYLIDDVRSYLDETGEPGILCRKNELFCDEFKSGKTVGYFRNPDNHTCEWKDKVLLQASVPNGIPNDGEYTGWFRTGTDLPCYPGQLSSGNTYLIQNSGDVSYTGWVGNCPIEQSECTEFRDPNDQTDPLHPTGKPYFFIRNSRLDLKSCAGKVDLLSGCVLFRDLSDARNRYNTIATYAKSKAEDDTPQTPIDCVTDPNNPYCQNVGTCVGVQVDSQCIHTDGADADSLPDYYFCPQLGASFSDYLATDFIEAQDGAACSNDSQCQDPAHAVNGRCELNNANVVLKVKLDRDCAQWLGCSSAETVYDPAQGKYVDLCTEVAMCDVSKGSNAGAFCAHYVDRAEDPILKAGSFFDRSVYSSRVSGFGELDYSGYAIPDRFQAADIQNRLVGKELFQNTPQIANKFATDYRLVAAVEESTGLVEFGVTDNLYPTLKLCRHTPTGRIGYTFGSVQPGSRTCYFAVDALSTRSVDLENQSNDQKVDPRNIQALADILRQSVDPKNDIALQQSLPPAECKAYPESDAPFPDLYVEEWDETVDPFKPRTFVTGYTGVNYCEFGEDCACSYRKVRYGNMGAKYISPFGKAPPAGLCSGGSKEGEACVPGQEQQGTGGPGDFAAQALTGEDPGCPGGGRCIDISSVTLVRGQFGQCLQRDYSRTVAGDLGRHPCLIWNPNPILSGSYDTNHFIPEAGYNPPVNSGEYYCLSYADTPIDSVWSAESHSNWNDAREPAGENGNVGNSFLRMPAKLSKFNYDRGYIAGKCPTTADVCGNFIEGDCNCWDGQDSDGNDDYPGNMREITEAVRQKPEAVQDWIDDAYPITEGPSPAEIVSEGKTNKVQDFIRWQNLGSSIDGLEPEDASDQGKWCAQISAWKDQDDLEPGDAGAAGIGPAEQSPDVDLNLGRWIQTGSGLGRTYAEYFFPVRPQGVYGWLNNGDVQTGQSDADLLDTYTASLLERNFAEFRFYTVNDPYLAACKIPKYYVDGVEIDNYGDPTEVFNASKQIYTAFNSNFDGGMNRSKEVIIANDEGRPMKEKCSGLNEKNGLYADGEPEYADADGRCYLKAWEINYRMDGTPTFDWLDAESGTSFWERRDRAYFRERTCSKSGFAIRAVFENTSKSQNEISTDDIQASQLSGPWQFVGFWVTACTAGTDKGAFLYLGMRVKHADICRQLAQTISPYSRESAAFADRAWSRGSFSVPQTGYNYSSSYSPFGAALVNGVPGIEPLFQTGGPAENYSILKPPVFLGSGQSYATLNASPVHRWSLLSNVFARIYRIYAYYDQGIDKTGYACIRGGNFTGVACSPNMPSSQVEQYCGGKGICNTQAVTVTVKNSVFKCNGLSGVNAGLTCGGAFEMAAMDPICHNAPMKNVGNGILEPQLVACNLRSGWQMNHSSCATGQYYRNSDSTCYNAKTAHEAFNAFGCASGAVNADSACSEITSRSKDCPMQISSGTISCEDDDIGPMAGHCSNGYEHARCNTDEECVFTESQWWGTYDTGKTVENGFAWSIAQEDDNWLSVFNFADKEVAQGSIYAGLKMMGAQWYPEVSPPDSAFPDSAILPQIAADVINSSYPVPFTDNGNNNSMANLRKENFERGCTTDGLCFSNYDYASTAYGLNHNLFAPFAAVLRWGAVTRLASDSDLLARWPSPHTVADVYRSTNGDPLERKTNEVYVIPGLCEGAKDANQDPTGYVFEQSGLKPNENNPMNVTTFILGKFLRMGSSFMDTDGGYARPNYSLQLGRCDGGQNDGAFCFSTLSGNFCEQGAVNSGYSCSAVATEQADGSYEPSAACVSDVGDPFSDDPDLDANSCTRSAGYKPMPSICGQGGDNEKCLTGYSLGTGDTQSSLNQNLTPAPTDVTGGFHTPIYLGLQGGSPEEYRHIAFYAPRPPTIAAPDLSRTCQTPGSCPIASVGAFTLENQSAGPVAFSGGQAQVNMRFYGWATQDQTPLTNVYVDWGDGSVVKIEEARMKNKKPFCGVTSECELVPGLTCGSDADCPPAAGKCAPRGTCSQTPSISCSRNSECEVAGKKGDKCLIRETFGNSNDACEANYFEFTHAFTCDRDLLPSCNDDSTSNGNNSDFRCARRPDISCGALSQSDTADCGGDACVAGLGNPVTGGCFDEEKSACVYTPRVILKDSFNWCTGDCRTGPKVGNQQTDGPSTRVKHIYGGCWDGTETARNTNVETPLMSEGIPNTDECTLLSPTSPYIRPWIVYPGAIEIGTIE
ncbi:MAG: hypothetical protein WC787_03930 [Patescibacteria group bacterium]|jgi:hypothetical protein